MMTDKLIESVISSLSADLSLEHGLYFFYGSPVSISQHMSKLMSADDKYPAVILFNEFPETQGGKLSHFGREAKVTLYLMTTAGKNWSEEKHINDAVSPMWLIADMIREYIDDDKRFGDVDDFVKVKRTNWGLILQQFNTKKSVFPDTLSGVEISFTLKVKRNYC